MARENLTVMIVDSSARAHALSDAYERSPNVKKIIVSPGNDFIGYNRQKEVVIEPGKLTDPNSFLAVAQKHKPDLVDVCQDDALAVGTVDLLQNNGFTVFGPTKAASRLEWDKAWARDFMRTHKIPHPEYITCENEEYGIALATQIYEKTKEKLTFIKAAGLCAGKGAVPARNLEEAIAAIKTMKSFGAAGETFLIEEGMVGEEASVYAFSDDWNMRMTKPAQDHKRLLWGDQGPNTGGMGAVAPAGVITEDVRGKIAREVIIPAINGMRMREMPYTGVLYVGVMVDDGKPRVVEFNSRWGAPEAEVILPGIQTPMDEIAFACVNRELQKLDIIEDGKARVCVVGASKGYPGDISAVKGRYINGLDLAMKVPGVKVYGAGIKVQDGKFYANGGRLFSLVAEGATVKEAQAKALDAMRLVSVEGNNLHYRTDIGWRDMQREKVSK